MPMPIPMSCVCILSWQIHVFVHRCGQGEETPDPTLSQKPIGGALVYALQLFAGKVDSTKLVQTLNTQDAWGQWQQEVDDLKKREDSRPPVSMTMEPRGRRRGPLVGDERAAALAKPHPEFDGHAFEGLLSRLCAALDQATPADAADGIDR